MRFAVFVTLLVPFFTAAQDGVPPVGAWRTHLPYNSAVAVAASDTKIFCATAYSFFSVTPETGEMQRYSKATGLSETGVRTLAFDPFSKKLIVAYSNSNIDILSESRVSNIPDLKRESTPGDKTIYQIYPTATYCYLATGLGVLVADLARNEIRETWAIGANGARVKVTAVAKTDSWFYAATYEGLKKFAFATANGADFRQWQTVAPGECTGVAVVQNKLFAVQRDTVFIEVDGVLKKWYADGWPVISIAASEETVFVCERQGNGDSRVVVLNSNGGVKQILQQPAVISAPQQGIAKEGVYWVADLYGGLSSWRGNAFEHYKLNAPEGIATGAFAAANGTVYVAAGSVNDAWNYQYNGNGLYHFKNEQWTAYNRFNYPVLDSLLDFITVAPDARDGSLWGGSYGGGLLHVKGDNTIQIYKGGTPLGAAIGDPNSYRISGLAFDAQQNLWIANYGAAAYLHVLKSDGTWASFTTPFALPENAVAQIVVDDAGQKWIVSPKGGGLILFNDGGTLENKTDDRWKLFKAGAGTGNLPSNDVLSIAKDKDGFIWVGTRNGAAFIPCATSFFSNVCDAVWPVVKDGAFAGYLFKGEAVQCIAIDGANRKWMGTQNGAWLLNGDGDVVLAHYTESNSPLLSNDVRSITVEGKTGEVFFGTAAGICSFRGTATETAEDDQLLIFPNPVPPGFGGTIAIKGLPEAAIVKIIEPAGRLVFTTHAAGGQAVWNGRDYTGRKVASGVYLVQVTTEARTEKRTGKLVFISNGGR